jgi:hypothetical protein
MGATEHTITRNKSSTRSASFDATLHGVVEDTPEQGIDRDDLLLEPFPLPASQRCSMDTPVEVHIDDTIKETATSMDAILVDFPRKQRRKSAI